MPEKLWLFCRSEHRCALCTEEPVIWWHLGKTNDPSSQRQLQGSVLEVPDLREDTAAPRKALLPRETAPMNREEGTGGWRLDPGFVPILVKMPLTDTDDFQLESRDTHRTMQIRPQYH